MKAMGFLRLRTLNNDSVATTVKGQANSSKASGGDG